MISIKIMTGNRDCHPGYGYDYVEVDFSQRYVVPTPLLMDEPAIKAWVKNQACCLINRDDVEVVRNAR